MKRSPITAAACCIALIVLLPLTAVGQESPGYAGLKFGAYFPSGDLDDEDFDQGFNAEVMLGRHFGPNFAVEGNIGFFESDTSARRFINPAIFGFTSGEADVWVVPLALTFKGVAPAENTEFYAGGGIGLYFVDFDLDFSSSTLGRGSLEDQDAVFGGHLVIGINIDVAPDAYFSLEGKYLVTDEADLNDSAGPVRLDEDIDLDGFTFTVNLGFRF